MLFRGVSLACPYRVPSGCVGFLSTAQHSTAAQLREGEGAERRRAENCLLTNCAPPLPPAGTKMAADDDDDDDDDGDDDDDDDDDDGDDDDGSRSGQQSLE